jgi:hypothetical protein
MVIHAPFRSKSADNITRRPLARIASRVKTQAPAVTCAGGAAAPGCWINAVAPIGVRVTAVKSAC